MDDKSDISIESSSKSENFSIGGVIRKQRISMNISIEKISKDLKISKVYIQAVEDDNHKAIPAASYVRVYIKTIAEYLSLDSAKLLKQLLEEKNEKNTISSYKDKEKNKNKQTNKDASDSEQDLEEKETLTVNLSEDRKKSRLGSLGLLSLLFVLLVILAYFVMNQKNEQSGEEPVKTSALSSENDLPEEDTLSVSPSDSLGIQNDTTVQTTDIEVQIQITRDSSWVHIFADGKFVREGIFKRTSEKIVQTAKDSVIIRLGNTSGIEIALDGKPVDISGSKTRNWRFKKNDIKNISDYEWRRAVPQ